MASVAAMQQSSPRDHPQQKGGRPVIRIRPVIPRKPTTERPPSKGTTPTFARLPRKPARLVEMKKPPRMIDLYDTAELIHHSVTGTELVVGIHKLTGEPVVIKAIEHSSCDQQARRCS